MHKKALKRNTVNPLTQKIKAPQHLSRLRDYEDDENYEHGRFQLPSLQRKKSWNDTDDSSSWGQNSAATSISWSQEMENVATHKLMEQWNIIEKMLYNEDTPILQDTLLEECTQWKTQIPHLRVVGKNPSLTEKNKFQDLDSNVSEKKETPVSKESEEILMEDTLSLQEAGDSLTHDSYSKRMQDDVLDILLEYVISELFPNKENEVESLGESLNEVLKITPAPTYSNRSSAKSIRKQRNKEKSLQSNDYEDRYSTISRMDAAHDSLKTIRREPFEKNAQIQQKRGNLFSANKQKNSQKAEEEKHGIQFNRNKLGTVFNERIVVSPVPFAVFTRESFSTLKTTPIRYMNQPINISTSQDPSRNILSSKGLTKRSAAWRAPVYPTVWPKNLRLAPIDTSRLPSSKNRSLAPSPAELHRNKKSLSPISRPVVPATAHVVREKNCEVLEIQGKRIFGAQSPKLTLLNSGWDSSPRIAKTKKKKKSEEG